MKLTQISASAGSGKTYTLTRHFLELLKKAEPLPSLPGCALHGRNCGYSLAELLAATFTNKAAAEMKARVVSGLKLEALEARVANGLKPEASESRMADGLKPEASEARMERPGPSSWAPAMPGAAEEWLERILRHYGSLNIRTIDSLLSAMVRLSALELGLSPDFTPSFDPAEYFTPLYDALMEELGQEPPADDGNGPSFSASEAAAPAPERASRVPEAHADGALASGSRFLTADAATLRASLDQACHSLLYLSDFRGFTPRGRLHDLVLQLVDRLLRGEETPVADPALLHERINVVHAVLGQTCAELLTVLEQERLSAARTFVRYLENCAACPAYRALPSSVYRDKSCLDECLNKASKGQASERAEEAFARFAAATAAFCVEQPLLLNALQLAPLCVLAHEIHARIVHTQAENLLPASRIPGLAAHLLSGENGVSDALCRMGSRLSRLLLDEFQDTSREQWAAILPLAVESLSTGGSLTMVGDVKQAIYGWRGGDARLFTEAIAEPALRNVTPEAECRELPYNWRSHPKVVEHNNAFFSLLADPAVAGRVLSAMLPNHTPEPYRAQAAMAAAANFARARQSIPPEKAWDADPAGAGARVRLYQVEADTVSEVNELVRARLWSLLFEELLPRWRYGDLAILVRQGDEAALAAEWLTEWDVPVVTENSFLLDAHPLVGQLISFLSFLEYPLDDLAFWECVNALEYLGPDRPDGLSEWLAATVRREGPKRPPLYRLFRRDYPDVWLRRFEPFYARAGLMSAYDTLQEALKHSRALERLPEQTPFVRRLLELAHLAEGHGHSSLAAFLSFWKDCRTSEKLPLPENMDAVRIITIHKAKGLEFPVVILPFQHRGRRRDPDLAAVAVRGIPLLTRAGRELPDLYYPARITDELERLNLLYVAWTRPVYALHAFITRPASAPTPLTRALDELLPAYAEATGKSFCEWEVVDKDILAPERDAQSAPEEDFSPEMTGTTYAVRAVPFTRSGHCSESSTDTVHQPGQADSPLTPEDLPGSSPAEEAAPDDVPMQGTGSVIPGGVVPGGVILPQSDPESEPESAPESETGWPGPPAHLAAPSAPSGTGGMGDREDTGGPAGRVDGSTPLPLTGPGRSARILSWRPMDWLPRLKIYRSPLPAPHFTPRQRGILAHLCLEHLFLAPLAPEGMDPGIRQSEVERAVRQGLRLFPLPLPDPERIAAEMAEGLLWFSGLPEAPVWMARGLREQEIMDDQGRMHRVDLLVNKADGSLLAVDYKTGSVRPEHPAQVRRYMRLAAASTGRPVRGFLVYLDERRLIEIGLSEIGIQGQGQ